MTYKCTPDYWDRISETHCESREGIGSRYARDQQVTALLKGLELRGKTDVVVLKTDLWTEGKDKHREVFRHALESAKGFSPKGYGMDISRLTCLRSEGFPVVQGDIRCLPYRDESFDVIWDMSTIDHVEPPGTLNALLEYRRCLKPQGVLVLAFTHSGTIRYRHEPDCFGLSLKEMKTSMRIFNTLEEYAIYFCNIGPLFTLTIPFLPFMRRFEYSRFSRFFSPLSFQYVIIARKA